MSGSEYLDRSSTATSSTLEQISSPVCVELAQTNVDAQLKAILLNEAGIRAVAVDDISLGGYFALGAIRNIHRPQVFVDKSQLAAAREVLARQGELSVEEAPGAFCYHCGVELPSDQETFSCPECHGLLRDSDDAEVQGLSDRTIQRGRSLFQVIREISVVAMLVVTLPLVLQGIYALYLIVSAPFRW